MSHFEYMNDVLDIMWGNLMEADKYIKEAHDLKDECRAYADWCRDMAMKHMEFNTTGRSVFDRIRDMVAAEHEHSTHMPGMMKVYDHQLHRMSKHTAEVKAMMDMYK